MQQGCQVRFGWSDDRLELDAGRTARWIKGKRRGNDFRSDCLGRAKGRATTMICFLVQQAMDGEENSLAGKI
jgi:hypothetical protein